MNGEARELRGDLLQHSDGGVGCGRLEEEVRLHIERGEDGRKETRLGECSLLNNVDSCEAML